MSNSPNPSNPSFFALRRKKPVRISYNAYSRTVIVSDEKGGQIGQVPITDKVGRLVVDGGTFTCGPYSYSLPFDQYDAAMRFADHVNQANTEREVSTGLVQESFAFEALMTPLAHHDRFQYAVVNVGMFSTGERMAGVLAVAGENGWELVTVYDKASNWMSGMEKGFMLLKRRVPEGDTVSQWCVVLRN